MRYRTATTRAALITTLLAIIAVIAGCTSGPAPTAPTSSTAAAPQRIVVLGPSLTESVYAVGAGAQVVAVDKLSTYPSNTAKSDLDSYRPSAEAVAAYRPDLVLTTDDRNGLVGSLARLNIRTKVLAAPANLDQTYQQINEIGSLTGHSTQAADLTRRMRGDIDKLVADTPKNNQSYFHDLGDLYSVGPHTFIGSIYAQLGLRNIADTGGESQYPKLTSEAVIKANPDLIFITSDSGETADSVAARPAWSGITAVRDHRIITLDGDIASRWGPRVVDLVRSIADAISTTR